MFQQQLAGQPVFTYLEDTATYFNAATTLDATTYVARAPAAALGKLLAIEALRIEQRCSTLTEDAFAREGYFEALAEIGASGREMSKADWAELYARFDQVMID